ncbi:MAG TPA: hypothetical protein DCZ72_00090 [Armatimonadetes bacterium]|nr:hypothetical protein [Armatimonadota bacterium]
MDAREKIWPLVGLLVLVLAVGWWVMRPSKRFNYTVPEANLAETAKGPVDENKYAIDEGGAAGTKSEPPGWGDEEGLHEATMDAVEQGLVVGQTPEMKEAGLLPIGDPRTH